MQRTFLTACSSSPSSAVRFFDLAGAFFAAGSFTSAFGCAEIRVDRRVGSVGAAADFVPREVMNIIRGGERGRKSEGAARGRTRGLVHQPTDRMTGICSVRAV